MGYDTYCYDRLALKSDVTKPQLRERLIATQYEDGKLLNPPTWKSPRRWSGASAKPELPEDYDVDHMVEVIFEGYWSLEATDDGWLFFQPNDDQLRDTDEAFVVFAQIASLLDPRQGPLDFKGEDDYRWRWEIDETGIHELSGETLYGKEIDAPQVVYNVVELLWPEGKEIDWTGQTALDIAELLRKMGYGPYAGKQTLEAVAESANG